MGTDIAGAIKAVELVSVSVGLADAMQTSYGTVSSRPITLVRVIADDGEGWGECVALEHPSYTAEFARGAWNTLEVELVPRLLSSRSGDPEGLVAALGAVRGNEMAKSALQMAVLDLDLSRRGVSLASDLGVKAAAITAGATVGLGATDAVVDAVAKAVAAGYRRVKCKIAPGSDVIVARELRASFPDITLCVDANGAYRLDDDDDRRSLSDLDELGLSYIEQPLEAGDLVAHAKLARRIDTPVVLDESIASAGDLEAAIALAACRGISIKPARLGGVPEAVAAHDRCRAVGLSCVIGGMYESGLARAAAIALGALPGFDLPGELGASDRYFSRDLTEPHLLVDGRLEVPTRPGIGRTVDRSLVGARARERRTLFAS